MPALPRSSALGVSLATLSLIATAASAGASVTVGQIPSDPAAPRTCASPFDRVQPTVTGGVSYVIPADGTLISWSTHTSSDGGGQLKLKIFRPVSGTIYTAVAQTDLRDLNVGTINTSSTSLPVRARSEEHTSELQSLRHLVCRLLLEKKK